MPFVRDKLMRQHVKPASNRGHGTHTTETQQHDNGYEISLDNSENVTLHPKLPRGRPMKFCRYRNTETPVDTAASLQDAISNNSKVERGVKEAHSRTHRRAAPKYTARTSIRTEFHKAEWRCANASNWWHDGRKST